MVPKSFARVVGGYLKKGRNIWTLKSLLTSYLGCLRTLLYTWITLADTREIILLLTLSMWAWIGIVSPGTKPLRFTLVETMTVPEAQQKHQELVFFPLLTPLWKKRALHLSRCCWLGRVSWFQVQFYISLGVCVEVCDGVDAEEGASLDGWKIETFQGGFAEVSDVAESSVEGCRQLTRKGVGKWKTVLSRPHHFPTTWKSRKKWEKFYMFLTQELYLIWNIGFPFLQYPGKVNEYLLLWLRIFTSNH